MAARKSVTLITLSVLSILGLIVATLLLKVRDIECQLDSQPCAPEVTSLFNSSLGKSIFFFDANNLSAALQETPAYQINNYHFSLPARLHVELKPQTIAYILKPENQTAAVAVTQEGNIITAPTESLEVQALVTQDTWDGLKDAHSLNPQLHGTFVKTISDIEAAGISVPVIYLHDRQTLALYLQDQPTILIDPNHTTTNIARLKLVLTELATNPASAEVQELDVRYKLPVLRNTTSIPRHTSY